MLATSSFTTRPHCQATTMTRLAAVFIKNLSHQITTTTLRRQIVKLTSNQCLHHMRNKLLCNKGISLFHSMTFRVLSSLRKQAQELRGPVAVERAAHFHRQIGTNCCRHWMSMPLENKDKIGASNSTVVRNNNFNGII